MSNNGNTSLTICKTADRQLADKPKARLKTCRHDLQIFPMTMTGPNHFDYTEHPSCREDIGDVGLARPIAETDRYRRRST